MTMMLKFFVITFIFLNSGLTYCQTPTYTNIITSMVKIDNNLDEIIINKNTEKLKETHHLMLTLREALKDLIVKEKINKKNERNLKFINLYSEKINLKLKKITKALNEKSKFRYSPKSESKNTVSSMNLIEANIKDDEVKKYTQELLNISSSIKSVSKLLYIINR
jgi:hypothetical protein